MPAHALSPAERERIVQVANEPRFAALPPARIVPMLADEGVYIASESSFSRVCGLMVKRVIGTRQGASACATAHHSCGHRSVSGMDLGHEFLPTQVSECGVICTLLWIYTAARSSASRSTSATTPITPWSCCVGPLWPRVARFGTKAVLHGDNGSTLKATTVLAMMHCLA